MDLVIFFSRIEYGHGRQNAKLASKILTPSCECGQDLECRGRELPWFTSQLVAFEQIKRKATYMGRSQLGESFKEDRWPRGAALTPKTHQL